MHTSNVKDIPIYRDDFLRPLRPSRKRYEIMAADTEDDSKGQFISGCVRYKDDTYIFNNQPIAHSWLVNFAERKDAKKTLFFTHNLAYDLVNFLWPFQEDISIIVNASRLLCADLANLTMYDTFNHSFTSAAKIGEVIGLEKLPFDPYNEEYMVRDTEIIYQYACFLQDMYLGYNVDFPLSLASGALRIWRTNFQKAAMRCLHSDLIDVIRNAYYGGRVEAYRLGEIHGKIRYYDVNSMYPYVMRNKFTDVNSLSLVDRPNGQWQGVIYADIQAPRTRIPVLPYRYQDGRTIYGYGRWQGWYTSIELDYAETQGYGIYRLFGFVSRRTVYAFKEFVEHFYKKRLAATTDQQRLFFKLIMNSLYGKFGTGRERRILRPFTDTINYDQVIEMFLGKYVLEVDDSEYPIYSNMWAYEVTAYARIMLHAIMMHVERDLGGEVLYCDTDSIIYRNGKPMKESPNLGDVKMEGSGNLIEIFGAKEYIFKDSPKAKGIPKDNQEEYLREGHTTFQKPVKMMEGLRRGIRPNVWIDVTKWKSTPYYKRKVDNKGQTKPWEVGANVP